MFACKIKRAAIELFDGLTRYRFGMIAGGWADVHGILTVGAPPLPQTRQQTRRKRHDVRTTYRLLSLHSLSRYSPNAGVEIELIPLGADDLAHSLRAENDQGVRALHTPAYVALISGTQDRTHSFSI